MNYTRNRMFGSVKKPWVLIFLCFFYIKFGTLYGDWTISGQQLQHLGQKSLRLVLCVSFALTKASNGLSSSCAVHISHKSQNYPKQCVFVTHTHFAVVCVYFAFTFDFVFVWDTFLFFFSKFFPRSLVFNYMSLM